jgi:hypothetical protein
VVATRPIIAMVSNMNPFIIFLALPAFGAAVHTWWREGDRVAALAAAWCLGTFGPYLLISGVLHRTSFHYYMAIVVPGICLAIARLFTARQLPRGALIAYVVALAYGFQALYPFRTWTGG